MATTTFTIETDLAPDAVKRRLKPTLEALEDKHGMTGEWDDLGYSCSGYGMGASAVIRTGGIEVALTFPDRYAAFTSEVVKEVRKQIEEALETIVALGAEED